MKRGRIVERRTATIFDSDMLISAVNGIAEKHRKGLFNITSGGEINYGHRPEREGESQTVRPLSHAFYLICLFCIRSIFSDAVQLAFLKLFAVK